MDVVLIGLPGSGKSVVGRRLAGRHGATFIDLDERIESGAGRSIPEIFEEDGEAAFRALERAAIADLGPADGATEVRRVIATGGGAVVDPRNRWALFRGRISVWLDGRPEVLAQRLRRSPNVRPLVSGRDPIGTIRDLAARRERFYAAATIHQIGVTEVHGVVDAVDQRVAELLAESRATSGARTRPTTLLRASTPIGRIVLGEGIAAGAVGSELDALRAPRAILVSEPGAWAAAGERLAAGLARSRPRRRAHPAAAGRGRQAARRHRDGGPRAGGDCGSSAATRWSRSAAERSATRPGSWPRSTCAASGSSRSRRRSSPRSIRRSVARPGSTCPRARTSSGRSISRPRSWSTSTLLRTLPERQMRAALGEAVKMAALGDERLFERLEADGAAIARVDPAVFASGVIAEVVERAGWAKVEVVVADERERDATGGRLTLNLGHSLGHAVEAAAGYGGLLHGEAVAYGLRAATRIGVEIGVTPPERAGRIGALLDAAGSRDGAAPLPARRGHGPSGHRQEARGRPAALGAPDRRRRGRPGRRRPGGRRARRGGAAGRPERERPMTTVLVLQGPNLNLVGTREPEIYGHESLDEIHAGIAARAAELGLVVDFFQSNHEGALIDRLHRRDFDVAIVNAGGLTHTSVALRDALLGVARPFIEVHLSDPARREPFRQVNFLHDVALESIVGQGPRGYHLALESIARRFADGDG